ncbi:hypothetical protein J4464_03910 [Candidatus Woesearchaeota archaeon]|nr:hypothetical protein [Candidatus Woesearchaeota archaeon]
MPDKKVLHELRAIRKDLQRVKAAMEDMIMTDQEYKEFKQSMRDFREGKSVSHEEVMRAHARRRVR